MNSDRTPEAWEKKFHEALRALPDRRAPHSLESRVVAVLAARAARPWWRQPWTAWPALWRIGFVLAMLAIVLGGVALSVPVMRVGTHLVFEYVLAAPLHTFAQLRTAVIALRDVSGSLIATIPSLWLYGAAAVVIALYAALFGLGAAAYRTFWQSR